jgi:hypothetical protein
VAGGPTVHELSSANSPATTTSICGSRRQTEAGRGDSLCSRAGLPQVCHAASLSRGVISCTME